MKPRSASGLRHGENGDVTFFVVAWSQCSDGYLFRCGLNAVSLRTRACSTKVIFLSRAQPDVAARRHQPPALIRCGQRKGRHASYASRALQSIDAKATSFAPEGARISQRCRSRILSTAVVVAQPLTPNPTVNRNANSCAVGSLRASPSGVRLPSR